MGAKVWDNEQMKMVDIGKQETGKTVKVSLVSSLAEQLEDFAKEDGFDFSGSTYETEKDEKGKTKKDKQGKPVYILENGKPKKKTVERSQTKVNSALSQYVEVAVKYLISARKKSIEKPE